jgi:4-hydroxy-tetrahydrodipicolinate synthase
MTELHGVLSALVTPFNASDETVDAASLSALVGRNIDDGVHGLVTCGSTGEFAQLDAGERRLVTETVIDAAAGRVPVVAQVGAMTTRVAIEHAKHAEQAGAAAVLAVAPYYEPLDVHEVKDYFKAIAGSVSIPVMVYNLPVATGVNLRPADILDLVADAPNIKYVKDTSGDYNQATMLLRECAGAVTPMIGWDTFFFASILEGAAGSVIGAANFAAVDLVDVYDLIRAGRIDDASARWASVYPLLRYLVSGGYVGRVKAATALLGHDVGVPRAPMGLPVGDHLAELKELVANYPGH